MHTSLATTTDVVILVFGTYSAQRAAYGGLMPLTAAHSRGIQDLESRTFLQVMGPNLRFRKVGRVGLEPTTGGL